VLKASHTIPVTTCSYNTIPVSWINHCRRSSDNELW